MTSLSFLNGGGEAARMILARDWSDHPLGPPDNWSEALRTALSLVLNSPESMILSWGPELHFFFNEAYFPLLGPRLAWAMGERFDKVWADGWEQAKPIIDDAFAGRAKRFIDLPWKLDTDRGQADTWWTFSYSRVLDADGEIAGLFIFTNETTARVLGDAALRESEERLQIALAAGNSIGTWDWDVPADRVFADARFAKLYSVDPTRARTGARIGEFFGGIHPGDVERVRHEVAEGLATGNPFSSEYRLPRPNGEDRWVVAQGRCVLSSEGFPLRFSGLSFDITERKKAEIRREALVRLTDGVRDLETVQDLTFLAATILGETLNVSRAGYGTIEPDTAALTIDRDWLAPGIASLAGTLNLRDHGSLIDSLRRGELVAIEDVDRDPRSASAAEVLKRRAAAALVNVPVMEQGRLVAVLFLNHAKPRKWSSEDLALVREIAERTWTATERLKVTEALRQANATLEAKVEQRTTELVAAAEALRQSQKMEAIGQLTGGIAHDFNNLLAGISGSLELLQIRIGQGRLNDVDRYLTSAQGAARRAAALTHRLLAFSRRQTLDPKPTDVNQLIEGMEDLIRRTVGPAVEIQVAGAPGLWPTLVDPPQLENALLNLCINARDAMPNGGHVTIETANRRLDDDSARQLDVSPGSYLTLCVTDNGTGMTPEVVAKAFEPFFTTKPLGEGTGLGLSMIYGFAKQSGGQVNVRSEVGQGTTVCIYLPKYEGVTDAAGSPVHATPVGRAGQGETVLVVDDEPTVRMLVVDVLHELGYTAIEAADSQSGLKILKSDARIDLLITDIGLPGGLNGRQMADEARRTRAGLKIIFITGYAETATIGERQLEPGMAVLTKPFALDALTARIKEMILAG